jgi:toxin CptA
MKDEAARGALKLDAPFFTEAELDELERSDPVAALRIAREQHALRKELDSNRTADPAAPPPGEAEARAALEDARRILLRDGGDLEFVALEGRVLRVRLKGACVGCPRSTLDLKHVVEAAVRRRLPGVAKVENAY